MGVAFSLCVFGFGAFGAKAEKSSLPDHDSHDERNLSAMINDRDCLSAEPIRARISTGFIRYRVPVVISSSPGDSVPGHART